MGSAQPSRRKDRFDKQLLHRIVITFDGFSAQCVQQVHRVRSDDRLRLDQSVIGGNDVDELSVVA